MGADQGYRLLQACVGLASEEGRRLDALEAHFAFYALP